MATKSVTLKDSNGDTLYPVTDSNVVNINQQKTLAQALDGVVYAEDPTTQAQPTAWVTSSDVDWSTMPGSSGTTKYDGSRAGTSWGDVSGVSFTTTTAGLYAITLHSGVFTGSTSAILNMRLRIGDNYYYETDSPTRTNYAGNQSVCLDVSAVRWIENNTTVALQVRLENGGSLSVGTSMYVTQIY